MARSPALKVLFVVAEASPFAKAGGLADVAGALPPALADRGLGVRVVLPLYRTTPPRQALGEAVRRALGIFQDRPLWLQIVQAGMRQDSSWARSAAEYESVYRRAVAERRAST